MDTDYMEAVVRELGGTKDIAPKITGSDLPRATLKQRTGYSSEYLKSAMSVGVLPPELLIEAFKEFLAERGFTAFSLPAVVEYMNAKSAKEAKDQAGWEWRPLRESDRLMMAFGTSAYRTYLGRVGDGNSPQGGVWMSGSGGSGSSHHTHDFSHLQTVLSNHLKEIHAIHANATHQSPHPLAAHPRPAELLGSHVHTDAIEIIVDGARYSTRAASDFYSHGTARVYDKIIPMHALRKVAAVTEAFGNKIAMMVCDYAPAPAIQYPDPFLMAVVPNAKVHEGVGRFVIDFWDEPGFGLEQQLR